MLRAPSAHDTLPEYGVPVVLHYSQGHWRPVPLPADAESRLGCRVTASNCPALTLRSISMVSATDGWAVGNSVLPLNANGMTFGVVLHYTGGRWVFDRLLGSRLSSVFMRTAGDGWMMGEGSSGGSDCNTAVFHYNGSAWVPVNDPAFTSLLPQTIVALSATNVWLAGTTFSGSGFDGDAPEVILHYDGSRWSRQSTDLANARIYGLAMVSPHAGWAVGSDGLIVHNLGGIWTRVSSPTDQTLWSLAMASPTDGWAVGDQGTILHYSHGAWSLYRG